MIFLLQPELIYVFMWCIQNTNDAFPELPIKERINLNFPGLNVKQNIFLRKVARPRCGSVGAMTPNSSYGGPLVWCMVSLHIIESVPGLLSAFPLHSCMQCGHCRQGRFISYFWICHVLPCLSFYCISSTFRAFAGSFEDRHWEYCWAALGTCPDVRAAVAPLLSSLTCRQLTSQLGHII